MVHAIKLWGTDVSSDQDSIQVPSQIALNKDGTRIIVSYGRRLSLYDCLDGSLIKHLKGHKDNVYSVSYSHDDQMIASGGADKCTIIWNEKGKGILKFTHTDSVQVVAYNPVEDILASCSSSDFGFWSPTENSVVKHKVDSKVTCASWRKDGQVIAIGLFSGKIVMYNVYGVQIGSIDRNAPILSVCWNSQPSTEQHHWNCIAVGCWDMTLSFYNEYCQQLSEDHFLECYPSSVTFFGTSNEYVIIATSSGQIQLHHREGIFLKSLCNSHKGWMYCVKGMIQQNSIVSVDSYGRLSRYQIVDHKAVYDKWSNYIAYRNACADIIVHDCSNNQPIKRIICKEMVDSLALLDCNLVVVAKNEVQLYELYSSDTEDNGPALAIELEQSINHIIMTSDHIIVSINKKVIAFDKSGKLIREWYLDQRVTCLQSLGVLKGEERIIVGCDEGTILLLSIDSVFASPFLKLCGSISSINLSCHCRYIGIIYKDHNLSIYDQEIKSFVTEESGPEDVLFHDVIDTLYCYRHNQVIIIKDVDQRDFSLEEEDSGGALIGFSGLDIYFQLQNGNLDKLKTCLQSFAHKHMKSNEFEKAFDIALLGSPDSFFHNLALQSLTKLDFTVAMKCYRYLNLPQMVDYIREKQLRIPQDAFQIEKAKEHILIEIAVMNGEFVKVEEITNGNENMVESMVEIFVMMRKFTEAKRLMKGLSKTAIDSIILKEATWTEQMKQWDKACWLYFDCGMFQKSVDVIGVNKVDGWIDIITKLSNDIPLNHVEALKRCCEYLSEVEGTNDIIKATLLKIKDYSSLMKFLVNNNEWVEIGNLCDDHINEIDKTLIRPYGHWLAIQGQIDKSIRVYRCIGQREQTIGFLLSLLENSIQLGDYRQVALLYRTLLEEYKFLMEYAPTEELKEKLKMCEKMFRLYYAYDIVRESDLNRQLSIQLPHVETVFNVCIYLLKSVELATVPKGVSLVKVIHSLSRMACELGAHKVAREALHQMRGNFILNPKFREEVAHEEIMIQARHDEDALEVFPICYRCGTVNSVIDSVSSDQTIGDSCKNCLHPFVRCHLNFDILPLVEFQANDDIPTQEAMSLIHENTNEATLPSILFNEAINESLSSHVHGKYKPVKIDVKTLKSLNREDVYMIEGSSSFFRNMIPEIGIAVCQNCQTFFHEEDYEYAYLKEGACPLCQNKSSCNYGHL